MVLRGGRTPHIGTEIVKGPASLGGAAGGGYGGELRSGSKEGVYHSTLDSMIFQKQKYGGESEGRCCI